MQTPVELNVWSAISAAKHAAAYGPLRNRSSVTRVTSSTTLSSLTGLRRWRYRTRFRGRAGELRLSTQRNSRAHGALHRAQAVGSAGGCVPYVIGPHARGRQCIRPKEHSGIFAITRPHQADRRKRHRQRVTGVQDHCPKATRPQGRSRIPPEGALSSHLYWTQSS